MIKRLKILIIALLLSTAAQAQVFIMEEEVNQRVDGEDVIGWPVNPQTYNQGIDSYTPIGDGILLLAALGGAYLLGKRKHER